MGIERYSLDLVPKRNFIVSNQCGGVRMRKRLLTVAMAFTIAFSAVASPGLASAAKNNYSAHYEEYRRSLSDRCVEFQEYLENTGSKQYGLLFQMRILSQYMLYTHFMSKYGGSSELESAGQAQIYELDLKKRVTAFNKSFDKKSSEFKRARLNDNFDGCQTVAHPKNAHKRSRTAFENSLCKIIPKYLKSLLADVQDDITQAKGDQKKINKIKADNTTLISNVYAVYTGVEDAVSDLNEFTPYDDSGKKKKYVVKSGDAEMLAAFDDAMKDYDDLIKIAKKAEADEETAEEIELDLDKPYVDNLSDAITVSGGVEIPKTPSMSLLYYAIMAASSVYVPLQSYAGSSEFQTALKSLTNDDQVQAQMVEFYSSVKDIRKPLYKREFNEKGVPTGTAKILTIDEFLDDAKKGNSGALCTVLGKFRHDSTAGAWLYEQDDIRNTESIDYDDVEYTGKEEIDVSDADDVNESIEGNTDDEEESGAVELPATSSSPTSTTDPFKDTLNGKNRETEKTPGLLGKITGFFKRIGKSIGGAVRGKKASAATAAPEATDASSSESGSESSENSESNDSDDSKLISDTAVFAYDEITDDTKLSESLYMYGSDYLRNVDNMTSMLMHNIVASCSNLSYISDKKTRYLYVNPFGDIVTDDNLIVFPGIANPLLYKENANYNPYTAAFMNTYPGCYKKSKAFKLSSKKDIGKYLIVEQGDQDKKSSDSSSKSYYAVVTKSIDSIKTTDFLEMKPIYLNFSIDGAAKNKIMQYSRLIFGSDAEWNKDNEVFCYTPLVRSITAKVDEAYVFPYVVAEDPKYEVAQAIAKNMYRYLTRDEKTGKTDSTQKFNDNFILHYFVLNGLNGTNNPKGFSENSLEQYNKYVANAPERFLTKVKGLCKSIVDFTSEVQGVIGLRDFLQSHFLGNVLVFCRTNLIFFFLVVTVFLMITFARMKMDFFTAAIKLFACTFVAYLCITLVPVYIPLCFNVAINQVSENMTYKILGLKSESASVSDETESLNEDGSSKFNTESVTLYRAGVLAYEDFIRSVNTDEKNIVGGNIIILNQNAGTFVEGDSIKINTDRLFKNLKIRGKDTGTNGEVLYQLKAYKTVSDNVDYYNPFYTITDSFITELNKMEKVYEIPRNTITYSNGIIKDNFLVYSFVNSPIFLSPGKYNLKEYTEGLSSDAAKELEKENTALAKELTQVFGDESKSSDFLRLSDWLATPTDAMKKTLWYKTMVKNHYYETDGSPNTKNLTKLVEHVNSTTKRFIFAMDDQIGRLSDDTMIKLIVLRATIDFNQQISDFGNWIYPFSLNYGDFSLKDVIGCIFVSDYAKYTDMNFDIIDYVGDNKGWFTLIVVSIEMVLFFAITCIMQLAVPVLYFLLCLTVILKLLAQGDGKVPVKGFLKCTLVLMVDYTFFALALAFAEKAKGSTIGIYAMLAVCLIVLYLIFIIVSSVLTDFANVGNSTVNARLKSIGDGAVFNTVRTLRVTNLFGRRNGTHGFHTQNRFGRTRGSGFNKYRYDSSVNDLYNNHK